MKYRLIKSSAFGLAGFFGYQQFLDYTAPAKFDFAGLSDKPKTIVIVGTGMVGLTTAYYLSKYPNNKIIVLEKNELPYQGTSYQNGNWLPVDYGYNWLDVKFYPNIINALKKDTNANGASRIYYETLFANTRNTLITVKFGFKWLFFSPSSEDYGVSALTFYQTTQKMIRKMIQDEKLDEKVDLGQFEDAKILMLQNTGDFSKILYGTKHVFGENHILDAISLDKDPLRFKTEVLDKFAHVPGVKNYSHALYRTMTILDTGKLGETLLRILSKKPNVEFKYNTEVVGYKIDNSLVKSVKTSKGDIGCDIVVLCNGP